VISSSLEDGSSKLEPMTGGVQNLERLC
jgi:hypothetical protein